MSYELHAFARAFFHGAALCWFYDGLTVWRLARKSGRVAVDLRDLLFWIFAALVTFRYFYTVSSGSLRGYLFVGIVLGSLAWKYSLSSYYVKAGTVVLKFLGKVWNIPAKVLKKLGKRLKFKLEKGKIRLHKHLRRKDGRKQAKKQSTPKQKNMLKKPEKSKEPETGAQKKQRKKKRM